MTREEASFILANIDRRVCDDELNEALDMAIKALEQEPCEDCISRQDALDCLTATGLKKFDFILDARDKIKNLPSVTPQPKTGHWILIRIYPAKLYGENLIEYECSECGRRIRCTEGQLVDYPYCHCGAKMEEVAE